MDGLPDAQALDQAVAGTPVPFPVRIGFSGCANNCGEALMRDIGVVLMQPGRFDIFIGGRPGSLTPEPGMKVAADLPSSDLVPSVLAILDCYHTVATPRGRSASGRSSGAWDPNPLPQRQRRPDRPSRKVLARWLHR